jgi:hypothetical protein
MNKPEDIDKNRNACICSNCPLFSECNSANGEIFFCGAQKSRCAIDASKMCICGGCAVYDEYDLSGGYFCINEITIDK